jgi:hypothetical protein
MPFFFEVFSQCRKMPLRPLQDFGQILPAVRSFPLRSFSLTGFALCRTSGKYYGEQALLLICLKFCTLLIANADIISYIHHPYNLK